MEIIEATIVRPDPAMRSLIEEAQYNAGIARMIYDMRDRAGLTQTALARKVGTTASVISRLEDADYEGHSLLMLRRIAAAVGLEIQIRAVPPKRKRAA